MHHLLCEVASEVSLLSHFAPEPWAPKELTESGAEVEDSCVIPRPSSFPLCSTSAFQS